MKKIVVFALAFFISFSIVYAQRGTRQNDVIEIRVASFMPRNSDWGRALDRMAAEWSNATGGTVRLRVIHDGVEGTEAQMLSSLSTNSIQAGVFTSFGAAEITPAVMTLSVPFLIQNDREFDIAFNEVRPVLEAQAERTNFVILAWSKGGSVNIFSREPVLVPNDLRPMRIATNPDSHDFNAVFTRMGFNLVEADVVDMAPRLANNSINSIYQSPAAVAPLGMHRTLTHMLDMPLAYFMGAFVMNRVTWNRLGAERQRDILRITQRITAEFDQAMPRANANAIASMRRDGLRVNTINSAQERLWIAELNSTIPLLLGTVYDRDVYNRIVSALERHRSTQR